MAIAKINPQTIAQNNNFLLVATFNALEVITPGMLIEPAASGTTIGWNKASSATALLQKVVALENVTANKGIEDDYAIGDTVRAAYFWSGFVFQGIVASGQDISVGERMESQGTGLLITAAIVTAAANLAHFMSETELGSIGADTRAFVRATS